MAGADVLVTGGTGFLGRALVTQLVALGRDVVFTTRNAASPVAQSLAGAGARAIEAAGPDDLSTALAGEVFRTVIHAAAPGTRIEGRTPESLLSGGPHYTLALLDSLSGHRPDRVVFIGSWSEYAAPDGARPIDEDHGLDSANLYGAAKASAYLMGRARAAQLGMEFVSARLFNVFGPGEHEDRLIPYILRKLAARETVDLTSGEQQRDFIYLTDAADAILSIADYPHVHPHPVYNVCSGTPRPVADLIMAAAREAGASPGQLAFGARPQRSDEPPVICGDPKRLADVTGWRAGISLEDGARLMVSSLRQS